MLQGTLNRPTTPILDAPRLQHSSARPAAHTTESRLPLGLDAGTIFQAVAVTAGSMLMVYLLFSYRDPLAQMGNWGYIRSRHRRTWQQRSPDHSHTCTSIHIRNGRTTEPANHRDRRRFSGSVRRIDRLLSGSQRPDHRPARQALQQIAGTHHPFRRSRPVHLCGAAPSIRHRGNLGWSHSLSAFKVRPDRGSRQNHQSHDYRDIRLLRSPVTRRGIDCHSQHSKTTL
jgi:hypothetical protein